MTRFTAKVFYVSQVYILAFFYFPFLLTSLKYAFMFHIKILVHVLRYYCRLKIVIYLMHKK